MKCPQVNRTSAILFRIVNFLPYLSCFWPFPTLIGRISAQDYENQHTSTRQHGHLKLSDVAIVNGSVSRVEMH